MWRIGESKSAISYGISGIGMARWLISAGAEKPKMAAK